MTLFVFLLLRLCWLGLAAVVLPDDPVPSVLAVFRVVGVREARGKWNSAPVVVLQQLVRLLLEDGLPRVIVIVCITAGRT